MTYDPSTNTLTGVAVDLNHTGWEANFTLNLNGYYTPPSSGNYVFGVGAATLDYGGNGALLYVATTQQLTTPPTPSSSSLGCSRAAVLALRQILGGEYQVGQFISANSSSLSCLYFGTVNGQLYELSSRLYFIEPPGINSIVLYPPGSSYWNSLNSNLYVLQLMPNVKGWSNDNLVVNSSNVPYSGGNYTVILVGTYTQYSWTNYNYPADGFYVSMFVKPVAALVNETANYTIPEFKLVESQTPYLIVGWDPISAVWPVGPGEFKIAVVYPNGTYVTLLDEGGQGHIQGLEPGDLILMKVTYDSYTNAIYAEVVDLNSSSEINITFPLGNYFTPPQPGYYWTSVYSWSGWEAANWGIVYYAVSATTQQTPTPPTPPTLPQNYQVVLNLLNGQQYFGVPHVYQGDNDGSPTNSWPVYYGPSNASSYWSHAGISSDQPVLELVPQTPGWASGAMFWSETYSGGLVKITIIGTQTAMGNGFIIYLFLKPTKWAVSPQYNYTIPYNSTAGEGWLIYAPSYPSRVEADVTYPQSSTPYIVVQWDPIWQFAGYTQSGATGQWNVWIVSNPSGNNASITPNPSPNLSGYSSIGAPYAGWDGIGTGAFQPNPGDRINITVTYNPNTNTLTGIAIDLNTGQSANFTLNLGNYYTPPTSGNYVFGVGATGPHWALLYVAMIGNVKSPLPSPTYYSVNFTEVGLPPGTTWNVTLNGVTKASSNSSIIFTVPNGEYNYSVASPILVNGVEYVATEPSGTVTVNNNNVTVIVQYVPTTPPTPSLSSLSVKVFNVLGRLATTVPGVVFGVLYNSSGFSEVAYMNSSGYLNFNNISPGTYTLEVYHYPNTGLNLTEYWGSETIDVQPGYNVVNFTRSEPWIYNLQAVENGNRITINVTVDDPLNAILHGELYIWVTTSPQTANPSEPTIDTSLTSITIRPGLNNFTYYYATTQEGTYYIYAALLIYNWTQLITTDQWNWTAVPKTYQLTFVIYSNAPSVSFELYESNENFSQGQIIASYEISGSGQPIPFNLPQGIYEYDLSLNSQGYTIAPSPTGFINLTKNEKIYLFVVPTIDSVTVNMTPVGLPDPSQWYVTYQDPFESLIFLPEKDGTILLSMLGLNTGANIVNLSVYSTNPQYYPLLPKVQINVTTLIKNNKTYVVPFATAGNAHIVNWNGVQWNPLLDEYSQPNFGYVYGPYNPQFNAYTEYEDGFCWGMSSTAILYYLGTLPLPSQSATYTNQLYLGPSVKEKVVIKSKTEEVRSLAYLTDASLAVAVHQILDPLNQHPLPAAPANEIASIAIEYIDWNIPVILEIKFTNQSGDSKYIGSGYHAVVAWGYVKEPNGDVVFLVYDPNYPQIITRAIYNPTDGSFIYIDGGPPYTVTVNGQEFSYPGDVGKVIAAVEPTPVYLSWFSPNKFKNITLQQVQITQGGLLDYTLYVSMSPLKVYTGGELVGYFINNTYFVTAPTVQPGDLAGYVDGPQWSRLYIVAVRNGFNASVDPNSTLVALRFANASGTIMVYGFVVNSTGPVAVRFVNQSSFVMASPSSTVVKLELFSVTNSSVKTYNTTLWLSNGTGYAVNANFTNLMNATIETVSWENITQTQTSTATTTTTNAVVVTESAGSSSSSVPIWAVVVDAVAIVIIAISTTILIMSRRRR